MKMIQNVKIMHISVHICLTFISHFSRNLVFLSMRTLLLLTLRNVIGKHHSHVTQTGKHLDRSSKEANKRNGIS